MPRHLLPERGHGVFWPSIQPRRGSQIFCRSVGLLFAVDEDGSSRTDTCGQAAKQHGQAAKAQLATGPAKHMSLDEMDKNSGMGVRVVESIEVR